MPSTYFQNCHLKQKKKNDKKNSQIVLKKQFCIVKIENSFPKIGPEQINPGGSPWTV